MIAAAAAVRVILVTSFGGSALPQRDQGEMCHAVGLLGCLEEHFRAGPIDPFQRVDREARLRIAMIERHGELLRTVGAAPLAEQLADRRGGLAIRRGRDPLLAARAGEREIVGQTQAEAALHRADFVLAVGVERGQPFVFQPPNRLTHTISEESKS